LIHSRWVWPGSNAAIFLPANPEGKFVHPTVQNSQKKTMPDSSAIPTRPKFAVRPVKAKAKDAAPDASTLASVIPAGPRKLIRPHLPEGLLPSRPPGRLSAVSPVHAASSRWDRAVGYRESSHAEAFYFQKQIQSQTPMIFVLDDGEQIEGMIEWYDRHSVKVKNGNLRTLIYKTGIKYLYKASDNHRP
jgi:sRNA-binding regulator protein Hfq